MAPEIEPAVARISRRCNARRLFLRGPMNYQAFTNDSRTMMYEAVRDALAADEALKEARRIRLSVPPGVASTWQWSGGRTINVPDSRIVEVTQEEAKSMYPY